jgi:hypothetical protein
MTPEEAYVSAEPIKPVYRTLFYYAVVLTATILFNTLSGFKSGVCGPDFDLLSIFVLFSGSVILLAVNLVRLKLKGQNYLPSVIIHFFVLIGCLLFSLLNVI